MPPQQGVLLVSVAAAVIGTGVGAYGIYQAREAAAARDAIENERKQQVQTLVARLEEKEAAPARPSPVSPGVLPTPQPQAAPARTRNNPPPARKPAAVASKEKASKEKDKENADLRRIEERLAAQDQRISGTEKSVEETRSDLEGKLASAKTELGASIARTHEEVVALQRLGERDYFEFQVVKSKQMSAAGPIHLALRKADTKRKRYNLDLLVDDTKMEKKNVYLFEPLYFRVADRPQAIELVVNAIDKDRVRGYLSVPKYKQSELRSKADLPQSTP